MFLAAPLMVVVATLGLSGTAAAAAAEPACGAQLTTDTVLTKDVTCAQGDGFTVAAGVVLDLGGHILTGPGGGLGVTLQQPGGQTIENGTIANWRMGVSADFSDNSGTATPVRVNSVAFVDAWSSFTNGADVQVAGTSHLRGGLYAFRSVLAVSSGTFRESTITSQTSSSVTVTGSTLTSTEVISNYTGAHLTVDHSILDGARAGGRPASCEGSGATIDIQDSTIVRFKNPIEGFGCGVGLRRNTFRDNPGGVLAGTGTADNPGGAYIENNRFSTSGIVLNSRSMRVRNNTFTNNVTGMIAQDPPNTVVTGNVFSRNSSSGIRVLGEGLTVGANKATNNGRYGINAPGAKDLGKNVAYGNKLGNCIGLTCGSK